jgi:hypothetical protein
VLRESHEYVVASCAKSPMPAVVTRKAFSLETHKPWIPFIWCVDLHQSIDNLVEKFNVGNIISAQVLLPPVWPLGKDEHIILGKRIARMCGQYGE